MADDRIKRVMADPRYQKLVADRGRTRLICFIIAMVIYFGLMLTLAFASGVLGRPVAPGSTMTVGIVVGFLVELAAMILVGVYVWISDRSYDPVLKRILKDAR